MSTALQSLEGLDFNALAALTGANVRETAFIPRLSVNREPTDEENRPLPVGYFTITQNDLKIFGSKASFRPFINAYQYSEFSPKERKFTNKSLIIKNFGEEPLDELGGLACGKVPFKDIEKLPAEEQLRQKNIKCRRLMYGLVTIPDAVTMTGEKTELVELPVLWKLSGSGFMAPKEALDAITKMKHQYFQHTLELTTKREKTGSTVWYNILVSPNLKQELKFTSENLDTFRVFQDAIERENSYIAKAWRESKRNAIKASEPDYMKELDLNDSVEL